MTNSLSDMSIEELKAQRDQLADTAASTDAVDAELSEREQRRAREAELLDLKVKLEEAKEAGLGDDLVADRIRDQIDDLANSLDTGPRTDLAAATGVDRDKLADMDEATAEQALEHLAAIEEIDGALETDFAERNREEHRKQLRNLLTGYGIEQAALEAAYLSEETGDEAAAVLAESSTSPTSGGGSPSGAVEVWNELAEQTALAERQARKIPVHDAKRMLRYVDSIEHTSDESRIRSKAAKLAEVSDEAGVDPDDLLPDGIHLER